MVESRTWLSVAMPQLRRASRSAAFCARVRAASPPKNTCTLMPTAKLPHAAVADDQDAVGNATRVQPHKDAAATAPMATTTVLRNETRPCIEAASASRRSHLLDVTESVAQCDSSLLLQLRNSAAATAGSSPMPSARAASPAGPGSPRAAMVPTLASVATVSLEVQSKSRSSCSTRADHAGSGKAASAPRPMPRCKSSAATVPVRKPSPVGKIGAGGCLHATGCHHEMRMIA